MLLNSEGMWDLRRVWKALPEAGKLFQLIFFGRWWWWWWWCMLYSSLSCSYLLHPPPDDLVVSPPPSSSPSLPPSSSPSLLLPLPPSLPLPLPPLPPSLPLPLPPSLPLPLPPSLPLFSLAEVLGRLLSFSHVTSRSLPVVVQELRKTEEVFYVTLNRPKGRPVSQLCKVPLKDT